MLAGTETGSLINHVLTHHTADRPAKVGDGATVFMWTDRYPATVVKVTSTQIHVQIDKSERLDKNGQSEAQEYRFTPRPDAPVHIFRQTKRGFKSTTYPGVLKVGERMRYEDPSH